MVKKVQSLTRPSLSMCLFFGFRPQASLSWLVPFSFKKILCRTPETDSSISFVRVSKTHVEQLVGSPAREALGNTSQMAS